MSTDLKLSLYNARSRRHSVALTRIVGVLGQHIDGTVREHESREVGHDEVAFEVGSLDVRDLGGGPMSAIADLTAVTPGTGP